MNTDTIKDNLIESCSTIINNGIDKICDDINNFVELIHSYDAEYNHEELLKRYVDYKVEKLTNDIKMAFDNDTNSI